MLRNEAGTIVAEGPLVLVCDCPGGFAETLVKLYAPFALLASILVSIIVGLRAAPLPILLIAIVWTTASAIGNGIAQRSARKHGQFRIDLERGEIVQQGRGFSRTLDARALLHAATPVVAGVEGESTEPGFEPRWLVLTMNNGEELRLGKGPAHALRPAVVFLREAGVEVLVNRG
ncbi:hypothetical protein [Polyangium sp. y55x31]|uniref:hypothetical protein n=1 Tax=Polyangium sp. y55x31 TaxID=3042688 RepID=UPI002482DFC6|nr:hypothetical protein [Polyangium sp. y55x31]MDI1477932.1 hypothetical protein [Polyangium sp. y55x31]